MHTLFLLEDMYGLELRKMNGKIILWPTIPESVTADAFGEWYQQMHKLHNGIIKKEEYDDWRYNYE